MQSFMEQIPPLIGFELQLPFLANRNISYMVGQQKLHLFGALWLRIVVPGEL